MTSCGDRSWSQHRLNARKPLVITTDVARIGTVAVVEVLDKILKLQNPRSESWGEERRRGSGRERWSKGGERLKTGVGGVDGVHGERH